MSRQSQDKGQLRLQTGPGGLWELTQLSHLVWYQRHKGRQLAVSKLFCFQQRELAAGTLSSERQDPGSHAEGRPSRGQFSFSCSHLAKPVCLLRDFLRIIRQRSKPMASSVSGHLSSCRARPSTSWGVCYRDPQWGERGHPKGHVLPTEEGAAQRSTLHPKLS